MTALQTMLVGHLPTDPPEATLVLAAAGACNGLLRDGTRSGGIPHAPSLRQLAGILGIHIDAVRRGVRHLQAAGEAHQRDGIVVEPEALRRRWHDVRELGDLRAPAKWFRVRLTDALCRRRLAPRALLLAGLVAGLFDDRRDELRLPVPHLAQRLGLPLRTVERLAAACVAAGAVHSWTRQTRGGGFRRLKLWRPGSAPVESASSDGGRGHRPVAGGPSSDGGREHRPVAGGPSSGGGPLQEALPEFVQEVQPGTRARGAEVEPKPAEAEPAKPDPERALQAMQAAILRTDLQSEQDPLGRLTFAVRLAPALLRDRMEPVDLDDLSAKARAKPGVRDPGGVLASMLAGDWRSEVDAWREARDHGAAKRRGAGTRAAERRDGPYGGAAPTAAGDVAAQLLAKVKHA